MDDSTWWVAELVVVGSGTRHHDMLSPYRPVGPLQSKSVVTQPILVIVQPFSCLLATPFSHKRLHP